MSILDQGNELLWAIDAKFISLSVTGIATWTKHYLEVSSNGAFLGKVSLGKLTLNETNAI